MRGSGALEAALEAEAAWRSARVRGAALHGEARSELLKAAKARAALGHDAHAVAYITAYLADGRVDPEAERLQDRLSAALVPVEIVVRADPKDTAITVELDYYGRPSDVLPPLLVTLAPSPEEPGVQRATVPLTPGSWNVEVPADGYYDAHDEDIEVVADPELPLEVELRLRVEIPIGDRPAYIGIRAASSPLLMGALGTGLLIGGHVEYRQTLRLSDDACVADVLRCRELLSRSITLRSAGTGLLGASVGVGAVLLGGLAPTRRQRAIVWGVEAGVGLGALVGGALGVSFAAGRFNDLPLTSWEDPAYRDEVTGAAARHSGGAFALGFGTSLAVYAVYYLIRDQLNAFAGLHRRRGARGRVFALHPASGGVRAHF